MEARVPSWKHWSFSYLYFLPLVAIHVAYLALLAIVQTRYSDASPQIEAVKAMNRPTKADVSGNIFIFSQADNGAFVLWQFVPVIVAVTLGLLWEVVDLSVRHLEPFYRMASSEGATARDSLAMSYVHDYSFLVPLTSTWRRHWAVALSSSIYVIAYSVLPALASAMWKIEWGSLDPNKSPEGPQYATISLDKRYIIAAQVFHGIVVVLAVLLFLMLRFRRSGLAKDPRGIGSLASLVCESPSVLNLFRQIPSYENNDNIIGSLEGIRFRIRSQPATLANGNTNVSYQILSDAHPQQRVRPPIKHFRQTRWEAHGIWLSARVLWAIEVFFLCSNGFILSLIHATSKLAGVEESDYNLSVKPKAIKLTYTFVIAISAGLWQSVQRELALFEPYRRMALDNRQQPSRLLDIIERDYVSLGLIRGILSSITDFALIIFFSHLAVVATLIATILLPPIYELLYDLLQTDNIEARQPEALGTNFLIIQIFGYSIYAIMVLNLVLILWRGRCQPFMPREPRSLASNLAYISRSGALLQSVRGTSTLNRREFRSTLSKMQGYCQLGWFYDGIAWFVGIEALPRRVPFVFGSPITA